MKFENTEVMNFEGAFRGMRNPLESWSKSDSHLCDLVNVIDCVKRPRYTEEICRDEDRRFVLGEKDIDLAQRLIKSGSDHRKFMRQIFVSVDITAPIYWWKEYDTYKVGTVANSTSTMHRIATTPITEECFELGDYNRDLVCLDEYDSDVLVDNSYVEFEVDGFIKFLEDIRVRYLETKDKSYWKELIRWLPESWLQTRTCTMNYENLYSMIRSRRNHKLTEWSIDFINWCHTLPYADELLFLGIDEK